MIVIHAHIKVVPDKREVFLDHVQDLIKGSEAEEGNISCHLYEDTVNRYAFVMVEEWVDAEALEFHNNTDYFKIFGLKAPYLLADPVKLNRFEVSKKL
ncbi:putative quinol monooxygenase [Halalkalibacter alkalisediminis]|uniref:Quinol monooxygenase n=1 Tax=Halalkalibacter alkalisediminis TaxID=935616 RepID=A0ABV6NHD1_9BACI|nr:putative quinol monooxygenase [Halalkalibacter alkalisediminis]